MNAILRGLLCLTLILTPISALALFDKKTPDEERKELQEARAEAMKKLYQEKPAAESEIRNARGYAVFSNFGLNLGFVSTQRGGGKCQRKAGQRAKNDTSGQRQNSGNGQRATGRNKKNHEENSSG